MKVKLICNLVNSMVNIVTLDKQLISLTKKLNVLPMKVCNKLRKLSKLIRSEERRVGKECRCREARYRYKKKKKSTKITCMAKVEEVIDKTKALDAIWSAE